MGKFGGSLWVKNLLLKTTPPPPPEKLSYPHKIRGLALFVLFILVLAFAGCTDSTNKTATYGETVNGIFWEVTYNTDTREILSIASMVDQASVQINTPSEVYSFVSSFYDDDTSVLYGWKYSGKPLGENRYAVSKVYVYYFSLNDKNFNDIKARFSNAELLSSSSYIFDKETGEEISCVVYSVEIIDKISEPEEMSISFSEMPS